MLISGRFVGDAYMRPVQFARYIVISGRLQRAAYMPPLRMTHYVVATAKAFPLGGRWRGMRRMRGKCPGDTTNQPVLLQLLQRSPSSVTCGDSFPQKGEAIDAVYPLCCCNRKTAGGAYPAPTIPLKMAISSQTIQTVIIYLSITICKFLYILRSDTR